MWKRRTAVPLGHPLRMMLIAGQGGLTNSESRPAAHIISVWPIALRARASHVRNVGRGLSFEPQGELGALTPMRSWDAQCTNRGYGPILCRPEITGDAAAAWRSDSKCNYPPPGCAGPSCKSRVFLKNEIPVSRRHECKFPHDSSWTQRATHFGMTNKLGGEMIRLPFLSLDNGSTQPCPALWLRGSSRCQH
jgi:hypothetical protein